MSLQRSVRDRLSQVASRRLRTRVWTAGRLLVLGVALGATFGAFFLTALRVTTRAREVKVPDIRNQSLSAATATLAEVGLSLRVDLRRPDPKIPPNHVLAQEPEPGTVLRRQRAVRVRVSEGQRDPVVPLVAGQAERTAEVVLSQAQVEITGRAEIRTTAYPVNTVVAQDPPDKQRARQVTLLVNRGQAGGTFVMPDIIGALGVRVIDILRRRGFRVSVSSEVPYPGLPPGVVVRQTPQAGFQVAAGDAVLLELSR